MERTTARSRRDSSAQTAKVGASMEALATDPASISMDSAVLRRLAFRGRDGDSDRVLRGGTRVLVAALVAIVGAVLLAGSPGAARIAPGCWGGNTHGAGSPQRVNAIPNGCVWVYQPFAKASSPSLSTRINGRTVRHALPRDPVVNARGICGVSNFVVQWPYVTVASDSIWYVANGQNDRVSA